MHDIGKVALVQSYPGLFSVIVQDLNLKSWKMPMNVAENQVAGGDHHMLVGRILAESWKLGEDLCQIIEQHHAPNSEARFPQLVTLANFVGGGIYPYPKQAEFPMVQLLRDQPEGTAEVEPSHHEDSLSQFLPESLLEQFEIQLDDLLALARHLAPTVRRLAEEMRKST